MNHRYHNFKVDPEPFSAMYGGYKKADLRDLSDRQGEEQGLRVSDYITFEEFDASSQCYTGRTIEGRITHLQDGYILRPSCVMISFVIMGRPQRSHRPASAGAFDRSRAGTDAIHYHRAGVDAV